MLTESEFKLKHLLTKQELAAFKGEIPMNQSLFDRIYNLIQKAVKTASNGFVNNIIINNAECSLFHLHENLTRIILH